MRGKGLIARCLQKLVLDQAEGIGIVPEWPTQPWFARLLSLAVEPPIRISPDENLLLLPGTDTYALVHPLAEKLSLLACKISGKALHVYIL